MNKFILAAAAFYAAVFSVKAQTQDAPLKPLFDNPASAVKNQGRSGTCWNFSTTSLVESEDMRKGIGNIDLSEMFTVRNVYLEKARNYILRQGKAQFGEGGLGHDLIRAIGKYGAMPQEAFAGMKGEAPDHSGLEKQLKQYLDSILALPHPIPANWIDGYTNILNERIGNPPATFSYKGKTYTPQSFAKEVLKFSPDDYISITSFTHHPFYQPFVLEAPDNFANGLFYNIPLKEMTSLVSNALKSGYTVMWDADVSNRDFLQKKGYAMLFSDTTDAKKTTMDPDTKERPVTQALRQELYENLTTQDDHLMHITGMERSKSGKAFFKVKNSWGNIGPFNGYIAVSEPYFELNTVSLVLPVAAIPAELKSKLGLK